MHKLYVLAAIFMSIFVCCLISLSTDALGNDPVVISQIYAGSSSGGDVAPTQEFISIYNNGVNDVDISNWCISNKTMFKFACFVPSGVNETLHLPSHKYSTIMSDSFMADPNVYKIDVIYPTINKNSGALVASSDTLSLIDATGSIVDNVSWTSLTSGMFLQRQINPSLEQTFIDTNTSSDFKKISELVFPISGLEKWIVSDVCQNIDGFQDAVPDDLMPDGMGSCVVDICQNIDGLQAILPDDMNVDNNFNCIFHDECVNLTGYQTVVPDGYISNDNGECFLNLLPLRITEVLPNAAGSDEGNEFIEIYNPNDSDVDLANYVLLIGKDNVVSYNFPINSHIGPGEYRAFYNDDIKFTLVNTSSVIKLNSIDNILIDEMSQYVDPKDNMAWALINGSWQYTNQLTPGAINKESLIDPVIEPVIEVVPESDLKPCAANQYRNPDTNRCRSILTQESISTLTPCHNGQYRSEETNRCRNIAADAVVLAACSDGEERNLDTNRCRSVSTVLAANDLKPCDAGQERNPETNRCRNVASTIPQANYAPRQTSRSEDNYVLWWSIAGVCMVAIIYGIWEWRQEIIGVIRKFKPIHRYSK